MTPIDEQRRRRLLRAARRGDRGARDRLVAAYLPLIRRLAAGYRTYGLPADDLVQEGCVGLLEAIDRYDPRRSPGFDGYARFRIRRSIRNALTDQSRMIRLPKHVVERRRTIDRVEAELAADGHVVTAGELAAATGLPLTAVLEARTSMHSQLSLDAPVQAGGSRLAELIADPVGDPEEEALAHEERVALEGALASLSSRQRRVVVGHWGLGDEPPSQMSKLAGELALSRRRTQAIGRDALFVLRKQLEPADR